MKEEREGECTGRNMMDEKCPGKFDPYDNICIDCMDDTQRTLEELARRE